jgi:formylglycine-generating enzyme required for sulfatase activity
MNHIKMLRGVGMTLVASFLIGCGTAVATPTPELNAGNIWVRPADGMVMVYVPSGEFVMGSNDAEIDYALQLCSNFGNECTRADFADEQPAHAVIVDRFWIDHTEITNVQYEKCVNDGVCQVPTCAINGIPTYGDPTLEGYPMVCVSWNDANTYCEWAGARLPTEVEWEYAARGPQGWIFPWGNEFDGMRANYKGNDDGYGFLSPVGSFPSGASWVGALDMAGNAWEWTAEWIGDYTGNSSYYLFNGALRGGSWVMAPVYLRAAYRINWPTNMQINRIGFRCARTGEK